MSVVASVLVATGNAHGNTCDDLHDRASIKRHDAPNEMRYLEVLLKSCVSQSECAPEARSDCQSWLNEVAAQIPSVVLDAKEQRSNASEVTITPDSVSIDGEAVSDRDALAGRTAIELDPGSHTFVFRRSGSDDITVTRELRASRDSKRIAIPAIFRAKRLAITFDIKERRPDGSEVALTPDSILIDGVPVANAGAVAGAAPYDVAYGSHTFVFTRSGSAPISLEREISPSVQPPIISVRFPSQPARPEPEPARAAATDARAPSSTTKTLGYAAVGLGIVGVGLGTVFGIKAISNKGDAHCDASNVCDAGPLSSARTDATIANIGVIGGAIALAGGIVLILTAPSSNSAARLRTRSFILGGAF